MARETALQRTKRELQDERDGYAHLLNRYREVCEENRRLSRRCSFLYERAMDFATEHTRTRLQEPQMPEGTLLHAAQQSRPQDGKEAGASSSH